MKILFLLCAFVFASTSLFSQSVQLRLNALTNQTLVLISANLQSATVTQAKGQTATGKVYVISRNQDALTSTIMTAIAQGKMINNAELIVTLKNGATLIHDFVKVTLSDYSSVNKAGSQPTEEFYLNFSSDVIRDGKK